MINNKVYGLLGLTAKAGRIAFGTDSCLEMIARHKLKLVIVAEDSSERTIDNFREKCKQNNIDFQFSTTDLLPNFPLKDFQLVEIMENLTANAIEHNMTLPSIERKLSISFYALDGRNEITVTNPVRDIQMDLSDMLRYGYSSKDSNHSGLGLFNIKQLADQNKLQFYGKRSDKYVSFTLLYMEESLI